MGYGVQLAAGQNIVTYNGLPYPVPFPFWSVQQYLVRVWIQRDSTWYMYDPKDTVGSNLKDVRYGEKVYINVSQSCYWNWDPPQMTVLFQSVPSSAKAGAFFRVDVTAKNSASAGGGYALAGEYYVYGGQQAQMAVGPDRWVTPGAQQSWVFTETMPSVDVDVYIKVGYRNTYTGLPVWQETKGPFTVKVEVPPPTQDVRSLEVAYSKV